MKIIRKILIASQNSLWAGELKKALMLSKKIDCEICSERASVVKKILEYDYSLVIFENSFEIKNIEFILRLFTNPDQTKPNQIIFCINDFQDLKKIDIPIELLEIISTYSMPLPIHILNEIITNVALPISALNANVDSLDKEFVQVLIRSTKEVLEEMVPEELKVQKPCLLSSMEDYPEISIRGKVLIKSEFFTGSLFISFPKKSFLNIYAVVVGEKVSEISSEEEDFASSMANMIYGRVKRILADQGVELNMAIPSVERCEKLDQAKGPIFVIPFSSGHGVIYIKIAKDYI
ncbi:hypothetical protein A9Q84_06300 [Halobacteriovorax marinus]|uniref:Chemotaxis phosphatase CheX-like domain-containing protein n=1 Tax=Halobacteriovorax marinus TaxID=97084 RepID=A0A1Y5F9U9_9BACT|nr:hypothetical protein A9Q84_06300 [Halobacteriovorax marinus]